MNVASCFVVLLINQQLKTHGGDLAIGAYGIVNRITFIFLMIVMGLNQGMQPIAGYNYGAGQFSRVMEVLKKTIFWASAVTIFGFLLGMICPSVLVSAFTSDEELIAIAARGLRLVLLAFPVVGFQIVVSSFFQSLGMANKAIFMSLSRQLLFLIPFLIFMPGLLGTDGVWLSMPMADGISAVVAGVLLAGFMRKLKKGEVKTKQID
jgi:Na+-driven multidrug efflux pump